MSFRLFIYYCAVWAGVAAFAGWFMGRAVAGQEQGADPTVLQAAAKGMFLGMLVTLGLCLIEAMVGLVEALKTLSVGQLGWMGLSIACSVGIGAFGGLFGGALGQALYGVTGGMGLFLVFGWTVTGFLIGSSLGAFDAAFSLIKKQNIGGPLRKIIKGAIGGTIGGILGGTVSLFFNGAWSRIFPDKPSDMLWSPSFTGFVALGMCIGLAIALAQVILKEAWVKVQAGFRPGRELILTKPETSIGRAEACDIGLFGDPQVERQHAHIVLQGNRYELVDRGGPYGTYLNDRRITRPTPLKSGDIIRVGRNVLCFQERAKSKA